VAGPRLHLLLPPLLRPGLPFLCLALPAAVLLQYLQRCLPAELADVEAAAAY
jgi:hypothetical protein